jgi:hypothetical protein
LQHPLSHLLHLLSTVLQPDVVCREQRGEILTLRGREDPVDLARERALARDALGGPPLQVTHGLRVIGAAWVGDHGDIESRVRDGRELCLASLHDERSDLRSLIGRQIELTQLTYEDADQ